MSLSNPDSYHKTSIPGVFVCPNYVDGDFEIIWYSDTEEEHGEETGYLKASTFLPDTHPRCNIREISTGGLNSIRKQNGIQIPGLMIMNSEIEGRLSVAWDPAENKSISVKFQILSNGKLGQRRLDGSNYDMLPGLSFAGEHELGPQPAEGRTKAFDPIYLPARIPMRRRANMIGKAEVPRIAPKDNIAQESEPDHFLYGRIHRSANAKLVLSSTAPHLQFIIGIVSQNNKSFAFNEDSIVQMYPFKKGYTFRIINCGVVNRKGDQNHEFHALYPELNGFVHKRYEGYDDTKRYPVWDAANAAHNLVFWDKFISALQELLGNRFVFMEGKSDVEINVMKGAGL